MGCNELGYYVECRKCPKRDTCEFSDYDDIDVWRKKKFKEW